MQGYSNPKGRNSAVNGKVSGGGNANGMVSGKKPNGGASDKCCGDGKKAAKGFQGGVVNPFVK